MTVAKDNLKSNEIKKEVLDKENEPIKKELKNVAV